MELEQQQSIYIDGSESNDESSQEQTFESKMRLVSCIYKRIDELDKRLQFKINNIDRQLKTIKKAVRCCLENINKLDSN